MLFFAWHYQRSAQLLHINLIISLLRLNLQVKMLKTLLGKQDKYIYIEEN